MIDNIQQSIHYDRIIAIFIDLLGTKNNREFKNKYHIHRLFHEEAKKNEERNPEYTKFDRKVYSFSDCAYFFYFFRDGEVHSRCDEMKMLQVAMYNTSISILRILNDGYLVRGGVALGDAFIDELGFFGPAVEEAYKLESEYADVPMIALSPELGKEYHDFEESVTDKKSVEFLMVNKPELVERDHESGKYYLNYFYQLEAFSPNLHIDTSIINIDVLKKAAMCVIDRDKVKYKSNNDKHKNESQPSKSTIYEKLEWMEKYLLGRYNKLRPDIAARSFSTIIAK